MTKRKQFSNYCKICR